MEIDKRRGEREDAENKVAELLKKQQYLKEKLEVLSNTGESTGNVNYEPPHPSEATSEIAHYLKIISQGFERASVPSNQTSDKFLARQIQGKDLPIFTGKPEEWIMFHTSFVQTTESCQYTDADNFHRLKRCLKGKAFETVQSLMNIPQNVPRIMKTLETYFGQPDSVVEALIAKARSTPSVKEGQLITLIEFGTSVRNLTETIKNLGCQNHLTNPELLRDMVRKLPDAQKMQWMEFMEGSPERKDSLISFAEWLDVKTTMACKLCPVRASEEKGDPKNFDQRRNRNRRPGGHVFVVEDKIDKDAQPAAQSKKCQFCEKIGHRIQECRSFASAKVEDRIKRVKERRLCFGCINYGHGTRDCKSKKTCGKDGCKYTHHPLLHYPSRSESNKEKQPDKKETPQVKVHHQVKNKKEGESSEDEEIREFHVHSYRELGDEPEVSFKILPIKVEGPKGTISVCAMLDPGADVTLIDKGLADALGLKGKEEIFKFGGVKMSTEIKSTRVNFKIHPYEGDSVFYVKKARTIPDLRLPQQSIKRKFLDKWKHLKDLNIKTFTSQRAMLLIGQDNMELMQTRGWAEGPPNAPVANKCPLGWVVENPKGPRATASNFNFHVRSESDIGLDKLQQLVKHHFTTESFGISPIPLKPRTKEDIRSQEIMDATVKKVGNRWESGLLWRSNETQLADGNRNALHRLYMMEKKMDKDPVFASKYVQKIKEYEEKGFARKLSFNEIQRGGKRTYYLPHFMNYNPKKPNKLRFVFDAAAKVDGVSLNDTLMKGPDQLKPLPSVLYKFRQKKIAITADIQDMFHRVKIRDEDSSAQRFLWRGMDRQREPDVMEMGVLIFGASCSPACAQEVKNKNAKLFEAEYPEAVRAITDRHYVDDYLDSCDDEEQAIQLQQQISEIHRGAGFIIRQWMSNSREVLRAIPEDLRAKGAQNMEIDSSEELERILGLFWRPDLDHFTFSLNFLRVKEEILSGNKIPTKREFLALTMSLYDPLGFLTHFTIKARMILQLVWRSGIGWDDELPKSVQEKWFLWVKELLEIVNFQIPRCYSIHLSTAMEIQLHVFNDASEKAFGSIAYFRVTKGEEVEMCLVGAKARVSPLNPLSIPRLELQAAVMGSRLSKFILVEHDIKVNRTVYWTDSRTVHHWINSDGRIYQQFVSHRVGEIQELTNPLEWKWIPGKLNVADELTRDDKPCDWSPESRWIKGPEFLKLCEDESPKLLPHKIKEEEHECLEIKKTFIGIMVEKSPLINIENYSSWSKTVRVKAFLSRFILNCKPGTLQRKQRTLELQSCEVLEAERWWWSIVQKESFAEEIECLIKGGNKPKDSRLYNLNIELDEYGIIRLKGRLVNADQIPDETKKPVVLDSKHRFTELLVAHYHKKQGHHGQEQAVNELRQRYHILNIRAAVKKAWHNCQKCRNDKARPVPPEMGQLPSHRLTSFEPPFYNTGLDYFGPIEITVGRRHEKRYGALFTCLSTRAVHMELAESLSTDDCILAIRRFIGRRNCPKNFYSDNGTNFVGAKNELKKSLMELNQDQLVKECSLRDITWHFNPPAAPHMGGSWERLVRSIKVVLHAILKEQFPKEKVLRTLLIEAEHAVNSHPLTHVPYDPEDEEALTPNHFLIGRSNNVQPFGEFKEEDMCLRKQWRKSQRLADQFWQRWVKEYIPTLNRQNKWHKAAREVEVGDIVVIMDNNMVRGSWPKGIVTKVYPGKDGTVRVVEVESGNATYSRPVVNIAVLDVRRESPTTNGEVHAVMTRAAKKKAAFPIETSRFNIESNRGGRLELTLPMAQRLGLMSVRQEIAQLKKNGWYKKVLDEYRSHFQRKQKKVRAKDKVKV